MPDRPLLSVVPPPRSAPAEEGAASADGADGSAGALIPAPSSERRRQPRPARSRLQSRLARVLVLVVVATLGAVAVGPRLLKGDLPVDATLRGTPARGVVRADRDYALVDTAATDALRAQAGERSLPVWDLDDERPRRDASVVQKALVRVAVGLEPLRRAQEPPPSAPPAAARAALDPIRAVVAGELASAGLEAPQDDAWRALVTMVWAQPGVVDVLATALAEDLPRPVLQAAQRALLPPGPVLVRSLGRAHDERTVAASDLVDERGARERLSADLVAALAAAAPSAASARASSSSWVSWASSVASWASSLAHATLTWNAAETDARRRAAERAVPPVIVRAHRGELVLRPGEIIETRHLLLAQAMAVQQADELRTRATLGTACFIGLLCAVVYLFGARRVFQRRLRTRDLVFLGGLLASQLGFLVIADAVAPALVTAMPGVPASVVAFAIPMAFGPMCARVTLPPDVALLFALVSALLGGVVIEAGMTWAVVAVLSSMTGAAIVTRGPRRLTLLVAGVGAGVVGVGCSLTLELFRGALGGSELGALLLATFAGGALSGVLAVLFVPLIELAFGYVTDGRLYRLADLNHPLLKDLIVRAPGTWHHSVRAAVLAERAAIAVGANPLLARVMALYHDIGKTAQPQSFRENQHGDNPHDRLEPEQSAAILRGHVDEGLALARRHRIPEAVADVIVEHHADLVMPTFLHKARQRAGDGVVDERAFRYVGRPPLSRESALVLLADQIESAVRRLAAPHTGFAAEAERLDGIVDTFVNRALAEDTLASCELSLRDLGRARAALKAALRELVLGATPPPPAPAEPHGSR